MSRSTLTSKGQTTIPKDARKPFTLPLENPLQYVIDEEWSSAGAAGDDRSRDTDRPETFTIGTNELIGTDPSKLPPAASRKDVIDVQYFLAQTLESAGQMAEAATLYSRIAHTSPLFKDAARRAKELSPMPKPPVNGKRETTRHGSWFGHVIESFNQLIGGRK